MQLNLEHVPFDCITRFIEGVAYRQTMEQKSATDVFSQWAIIGKDEGMERGHAPSVKAMLELALPKVKENFTAIDLGCGNGWVVRLLSQLGASHVEGVDGAEEMINKAKDIDSKNKYSHGLLPMTFLSWPIPVTDRWGQLKVNNWCLLLFVVVVCLFSLPRLWIVMIPCSTAFQKLTISEG